MKKSVDINIEIIVGATIAILDKGFPDFFWSRTRAGLTRTDWSLEQLVDAK